MTTPTKTYDESLERIKWFSKCFEKPKNVVIHDDVNENLIRNNQTESNQDFMDFIDYLHEKDYLNMVKIIKDKVHGAELYGATIYSILYGATQYSILRDVVKDFNNK